MFNNPVNPDDPLVRPSDMTSAAVMSRPSVDIDSFVRDDYARVVAAVGLATGARQLAEDAVQDAVVKLLQLVDQQSVRSIAGWVTVVATNLVRDRIRREGAESRAVDKLVSSGATAGLGSAADLADDVTDQRSPIMLAIETLPPQQREICVMFYFLDVSIDEIATSLDVKSGTVKTQLFRARQSLAKQLGEPQPEELI